MGTWVLAAAFFTGPMLCLAALVTLTSDAMERLPRPQHPHELLPTRRR